MRVVCWRSSSICSAWLATCVAAPALKRRRFPSTIISSRTKLFVFVHMKSSLRYIRLIVHPRQDFCDRCKVLLHKVGILLQPSTSTSQDNALISSDDRDDEKLSISSAKTSYQLVFETPHPLYVYNRAAEELMEFYADKSFAIHGNWDKADYLL